MENLNRLVGSKNTKKESIYKYEYEKRVVNLTDVEFNTEEKEILAKGLKYAPPPEINQEKTIIECESIIQKLGNENDKKTYKNENK